MVIEDLALIYVIPKETKELYTENYKTLMKEIGGFPGGSEVKASTWNAGDPGSIPGSGRSPGEGNGNPLHYSCLENPMEGGAWLATVHGVEKSQTRLCDFTFTLIIFKNIYPQRLLSISFYKIINS